MSISSERDLEGMRKVSEAVAHTLRQMREYAAPGMSTKEIDEFGGKLLKHYGAKSAPAETYGFPGWTCISVNNEVAHGIPTSAKILKEGDLVNIDVSAELNGYWGDNGGSFVLGEDIHFHGKLVEASRNILRKALAEISCGIKISDIGGLIEEEAKRGGFTIIKNLAGHGIGRKLHEEPANILNYRDRFNRERFKENSVVAVETFISTKSKYANTTSDGWTLVGNRGGFVAQHEHTIIVTKGKPVVLTDMNGIWGD